MIQHVEVVDYDPVWPERFRSLRDVLWPVVKDLAIGIEHVGSTSVPGLASKPIIDLDIIIPEAKLQETINRLEALGYIHEGNLGFEGREAFKATLGSPRHHLYVCVEGCTALQNHLLFRDYLRRNPTACREYSELKKGLAACFEHSVGEYTQRKTDFILSTLALEGLETKRLEAIRRANLGLTVDNS
jgi:GrpB-like predicted nucleotidyltransferase (UPF0157 family)